MVAKGYQTNYFAPALNQPSSIMYIAMHLALKAHGRIFQLYNKKYRSKQNGA